MKNYLSIDIGGTNVKYALLNHNGRIIWQKQIKTEQEKERFLSNIDQIVSDYATQIKGLAFCAPGKVVKTKIHFGGSLPFLDGIDFAERYRSFDIPVAVINDGKASALAESWLGNLKGIDDCAAITLGTGVGGGIILNGKLINGFHSQAGELSFIPMKIQHDQLKDMAGGYASAVKMIEQVNTVAKNSDLTDGIAAFKAINDKNSVAQGIFKVFCKRIAYLILTIQSVVDLQRVVVGGGISAQPSVVKEINHAYDIMLKHNDMLRETLIKPEIVSSKFKNDANILGALNNLLQINSEGL